jgi:hypothetical protein
VPTLDLNWMMWDATTKTEIVGWPLPVAPTDLWMYQRVTSDAPEYKAAGITRVSYPPLTLGSAGRYSGGYDKKEDYVFDGTAFGDEAMLIDSTASVHKHGMRTRAPIVLHQMDGYPNQNYTSAIFPKTPACFAWYPGMPNPERPGNVGPDAVPDPSGGWPDGDLCAYVQPGHYMWDGAIAAWRNQMHKLGIDDGLIDEAKDLNPGLLQALIDAVRETNPDAQFCGEYFDGSNYALGGWVNYWMNRKASCLDFGFKFNVGTICNNNSKVWMGQLSEIGYCMVDSMKADTFVENHDTDTTEDEQTIWNKPLGYDIMFSFPGEPNIYYRDWSTDGNCYGLKRRINNGLWRWHHLAQGAFVTRNAEYQTFACERLGYGEAPGCICFFNNDQWNAHTVTAQTRYGSNMRLHEFTGNNGYSADKWTDFNGQITVTVPRNVNGCNSLVYGPYL